MSYQQYKSNRYYHDSKTELEKLDTYTTLANNAIKSGDPEQIHVMMDLISKSEKYFTYKYREICAIYEKLNVELIKLLP